MKRKLAPLLLILLFIFSVVPLSPVGAIETTFGVEPDEIVEETLVAGSTFAVEIWVRNVVDLAGVEFKLGYDTTVLTATLIEYGGIFGPTFFPLISVINDAEGWLGYSIMEMFGEPSFDGDGIAAIITFTVDSEGESALHLYETKLGDPVATPITHTTIDGYFDNRVGGEPPPPTQPDAEFTPPTSTVINVYDNVTLDASASTDGWDTLPDPGHAVPIVNYMWEIDFGCNGTIELTLEGEYIEDAFQCEESGDVCINLTVYAPDPTPPTHPDCVEYNSEVHVIHQKGAGIGPAIDVYTEKGGEGPGIDPITSEPYPYPTGWSDAFEPQEEVTVYAHVTYNDEPVEYQPVAFEIKDPTNETRVTRTAFTNASGIATTEFSIPWMGSNAEEMFGNWTIIGTVKIPETTVMDICKFRFGYILSIRGIVITNSPLHKSESLGVTVDIKNIAITSKDAFFAIVLYDECGVPIGIAKGSITVDPENGLTSEYTIPIPTWAFVGTGTVYVNIFTKQPIDGGTPMCPEGAAIFTILKTQ